MAESSGKGSAWCVASPEDCINSRRCFMTGEHCSKQLNIQQERKKLHSKQKRVIVQPDDQNSQPKIEYIPSYEINAFVVMNFSDMSNVVYKWRLKSFIESLKKYLYLNPDTHQVQCVNKEGAAPHREKPGEKWEKIDKINVIRSDSNPASNYVICNRVCQQMQLADIVIVDVSVENTNVFYEFGMAMAFGKLILPICYNESIFEHAIPRAKKDDGSTTDQATLSNSDQMDNAFFNQEWSDFKKNPKATLEKHIDCFQWRRRLFEYYGLRFKTHDSWAQYAPKDMAFEQKYNFTDQHYQRFPYSQTIDHFKGKNTFGWNAVEKEDNAPIGERIYALLRHSYNTASPTDNTLVVYTMDGFMNGGEAGQCIINFYTHMTAQMKKMQCFQGDRVGILVQENKIKEDQKDARARKDLLYNIGNIIHIGMNQATYVAQKERIKTGDFLPMTLPEAPLRSPAPPSETREEKEKREQADAAALQAWKQAVKAARDQQNEWIQVVKEHVGNRSVTILPEQPVYVDHVKDGIQKEVFFKPDKCTAFEKNTLYEKYYCLYHIMLRTLRYTNEIVVDISNNSIQALFWLGAAHGSDTHAITVRYARSDKEKAEAETEGSRPERMIFDVSGLWTAILRSHDTDGFYKELMQAQLSIEQHTKLVLEELDIYSEQVMDYLYEASYREHSNSKIDEIVFDKQDKEARKLESYYRDYFWRRMLRYNRLHIFLPQFDDKRKQDPAPAPHQKQNTDPRLYLVKWDVDALAELSHYLSKRKVIGEYYIEPLETTGTTTQDKQKKKAENNTHNFVCIGGNAKPFLKDNQRISLPRHIADTYTLEGTPPHELADTDHSMRKCDPVGSGSYHHREFAEIGRDFGENNYFTYVPTIECYTCATRTDPDNTGKENWKNIHRHTEENEPVLRNCPYENDKDKYRHLQLAQMFLWREVPASEEESIKFQVALTGASGPATQALSAILVDREQKISMFGHKWDLERDRNKLFLNELQGRIRKTFTDQFFENVEAALRAKLPDGVLSKEYEERITLIRLYLSTVLYRYFLPFLTWEDEYRICNGMEVFLITLRHYKNQTPVETIAPDFDKTVLDCLRTLLKKFKGVEAMYAVTVEVQAPDLDRRKVLDIQLASDVMEDQAKKNGSAAETAAQLKINDVTCFFGARNGASDADDAADRAAGSATG